MLSYHNDENLKCLVVSEMKKHQEKDQFIKGAYDEEVNGEFKGCAVGCTIDSINLILGKSYRTSEHKVFEEAIGVPEWLARLQDSFFENLPRTENGQFAIDFLQSIPIGINLEPIKWKFCSFILKEGIDRILLQPGLPDELRWNVVNSMRGALNLHELAIKIGEWDQELSESAESAARSAAWSASFAAWSAARAAASSAAKSAAWSASSAAWSASSAAESAARSAEWSASSAARSASSAAWSASYAAYRKYADELIMLLKEA